MPSGLGFWLEPGSGKLFPVTTHNDWLLIPEHQDQVGLDLQQRQVLASCDPVKEIDEIRMVGVMHGLVRLREYAKRLSIQFYCKPEAVQRLVAQVASSIKHVTHDPNPYLTIQNLYDDSVARLEFNGLIQLLATGDEVLKNGETFDYNLALRRKMAFLFSQVTPRN